MKKNLFLVSLLAFNVYGSDTFKYAKRYFEIGGVMTSTLQTKIENDSLFIKANQYLENKDMMKNIKVDTRDPEVKGKPKMKETTLPDWGKALPLFIQSAKEQKNPISAYQGLYAINSFIGINNYKKEFKELATVFYENEKNICEAYLYLGEVYQKGIAVKVDKAKANKIFREALSVESCKKGWYAHVIPSKVLQTK